MVIKMSLENEKLSQLLGNTDDDLLDEAYRIDSADKLQKKIKGEKALKGKGFALRPSMRIAVAAMLVIVCVISISLVPALFGRGNSSHLPENPSKPVTEQSVPNDPYTPDITLPSGRLHIDGLDMLNYYYAIRSLADESGYVTACADGTGKLILLDGFIAEDEPSAPLGEDVSKPEFSRPDNDHVINDNVIYYDIDPDQPIVISKVLLFRIELTDERGFLASKLGTGVIDVVISKEFVFGDDLITFKNGERYFSCLTNGGGIDYMEFTTHKYIEGFSVVKNLDQENYSFTVSIAGDQVIDFQCGIFKYGSTPDEGVRVVSKTSVVNETHTYTLAELEDYFNRGDLTQPDNADL